ASAATAAAAVSMVFFISLILGAAACPSQTFHAASHIRVRANARRSLIERNLRLWSNSDIFRCMF
ncbi:MAG: hypothetical protein KGM93_00005, partial [Sphingomonadales bacterium]|nr:hypothetical protein [Sphingomonadales bacterium]